MWSTLVLVTCLGLLDLCKGAPSLSSSVWNMPWPVAGYKSYLSVMPMRYETPAGLASLNISFSGMKTGRSCPERDIHIVIENGGLPLVDLAENSLPEHFITPEDPSIKLVIKPGQIAELSLIRPPPGPWYIVGYLKGVETAIKQKGLHAEESCNYLYMSMAKFSAPIKSTEILPGDEVEAVIDAKGSFFSFAVPSSAINFEVNVLSCEPAPCPLSLRHLTFVPRDSQEVSGDCSSPVNSTNVTQPCLLHVSSPLLNDVQMIKVKFMGDRRQNRTIVFKLEVQECSPFATASAPLSCGLTPPLDRIQSPFPMTTRFGAVGSNTVSLVADLAAATVTSIPFTILEPNDVGGTLKWQIRLVPSPQTNISTVQVCGGLMYNKLPDTSLSQLDLCKADIPGLVNLTQTVKADPKHRSGLYDEVKRYIAYPQAGQWHIVLQSHCFTENRMPVDCGDRVLVEMMLEVQKCVDGECSGHGTCRFSTTGTDLVSFSVCQCDADYRGYGCSDARHAQSVAVQLAGAYLLTLSNLFFIPAIVLGLRRGFLFEAFVYFFTMFFST
ncbi:transmembrane protein 8A, partial [Elysia marginata]